MAGAAAGMSATFATPIAAVLLAVELLLFEWKPRSAIPVALASAAAGAARRYILGMGPLFPVPPHPIFIGPQGLLGCVVVGLVAGCLSSLLTLGVYAAEDSFLKLPFHWKWWPAIGGLAVGLGGLIFPQRPGRRLRYHPIPAPGRRAASGDRRRPPGQIGHLDHFSGSGTSGGVLAPLLMMGAAMGGVEAMFLPSEGVGFWPW